MKATTLALSVVSALLLTPALLEGAPASITVSDVIVTATPDDREGYIRSERSPVGVLAWTPGLVLTSQGVPDSQSDISIKGSAFSGAGIMVSGLFLGNAQTEHFNSELPVDPALLGRGRVVSGLDQSLAGDGYLVGAIAFDLATPATGGYASFGGISDGGYWASAAHTAALPYTRDASHYLSLFGGVQQIDDVDLPGNDLESARGGFALQRTGDDSRSDLVVGHQRKRFGARGYYGVTPAWDAEEELEDTLVLGTWERGATADRRLRASLAWRQTSDDYTLFWTLPGIYHNEHQTDLVSGSLEGAGRSGQWGWLWRVASAYEQIESTNLGDHNRTRASLTAIPSYQAGPWRFWGGARLETFEESDETDLLPQLGLELSLPTDWLIRASYTETVREPSYTELNYDSPGSLGDSGLENQHASSADLRVVAPSLPTVSSFAGLFYRVSRDTVDWVRETDESTRWQAVNLDRVETTGLEGGVDWHPTSPFALGLFGQLMEKETSSAPYSSRYALDYPRALLQLTLGWQASETLRLEYFQQARRQQENALRPDDNQFLGHIAAHWFLPQLSAVKLSLYVHNLWDDDFWVYPGQATVTGRRASASLSVLW